MALLRSTRCLTLSLIVLAAQACGDDDSGGSTVIDAGPDEGDSGSEPINPIDAGPPRDAGPTPPRGECGNGRVDSGEACDDGNDRDSDGCSAECETESGFHCVVAGSACEECGNGIVESAEQCDDGNVDDADGCDTECQFEMGFSCPVAGQACEQCGNGVLEANERCDEGSVSDGVGCADDCHDIDPHFACPAAGTACVQCGDGVVGGDEQCDDGNTASGDGCVFNCSAEEPGFRCASAGGGCTLCGDGKIEGSEQCDDGNFAASDGCSDNCDLEPGAQCFVPGVLCSRCGNGYIEFIARDDNGTPSDPSDDFFDAADPAALEGCDDGNRTAGDGCSDSCTHEDGGSLPWLCPIPGLACGRCGDGVKQAIEGCDDGLDSGSGMPVSNDGCSADCTTIESNFTCPAAGGACAKCGDGQLAAGLETCDDANVVSGDGCNRLCQLETNVPWVCHDPGTKCELCGNGVIEVHELCDDGNRVGSDGCAADCSAIDSGYNCFFAGFACARCGDGNLSPGERCDEGDIADSSRATAGCDDRCQVVAPWTCPIAGESCVKCGDNVVGAAESCEDGNTVNNDGCSAVCQIEPGYDCSSGDCLASSCGDGFRAGSEECDDGNNKAGDGCNFVCDVEQGWSCEGGSGCHRTLCGDGVVEGEERCDDGSKCSNGNPCTANGQCAGVGDQLCKARAGDGCNASCGFEPGYYCPMPNKPCLLAPCGDGMVQGAEQCDDGKHCTDLSVCTTAANCVGKGDGTCAPRATDGCNATCNLETNFYCPDPGQPCLPAVCGNGKVEGLEQCDDGPAASNDGCSVGCTVEPLYRCKNEPNMASKCKPILEFVSIQRFNISQVSPAGLNYEPDRRAFAGHKTQDSQPPIELCLDGTILDPTDTSPANPYGSIMAPDGTKEPLPVSCAAMPTAEICYEYAARPVSAGTLVGSTYDPFTDHYLFLTVQGQDTVLTDIPRDFDPATQKLCHYQVELSDLASAADLTIGEDGDLYVADSSDVPSPNPGGALPGMIKVFERRRNAQLEIVDPGCAAPPNPTDECMTLQQANTNCTTFVDVPDVAREWSAATATGDVLSGLFSVPGEDLLGVFNAYQGAVGYSGLDWAIDTDANTAGIQPASVPSSEYFTFFDPAAPLPVYGRSALPGLLFSLGDSGTSYTKYSKAAETAADGGAFIVCPLNPSEDCQLFARTCFDDADCAEIVPGTSCNTASDIPYCHSPGDARDDGYQVDRGSASSAAIPLDVLANDSLSESACVDPNLTILSVCGDGVSQAYETAHAGHCADDGVAIGTPALTTEGDVTYDAPDDGKCGFLDTFTYTVDLGGGVIDTATVRVLVACVCGDGVVDSNEQCDQGAGNMDAGTLISGGGTPDKSDDVYARCSDSCLFNVYCGDGYIVVPEECDDRNALNGDGCSEYCTLESVCGNAKTEGVEQCDDGNAANGDLCNTNCTLPKCGDGSVDVQKGETCDDGNLAASDGCDNLCHVEKVCGNRLVELGEDCDDGNRVPGDGCSAQCTVENVCGNEVRDGAEACDGGDHGSCPLVESVQIECTNEPVGAPNLCVCANYCGDGAIGGLEECDAGASGSATCRAPGSTRPCSLIRCGDGIKDGTEACDDGNTNPADACTNDCKVVTICGNNMVEGSEQCDDGNNRSGDGCSSACRNETTVCGDNVLDFDEQCDDGNTSSGDGCDSACLIEGGSCGNGKRDLGEQCDDGNTTSDDGCSAACQLELCGNGTKDSGEECDDGDQMSGDGCSALCRIEIL